MFLFKARLAAQKEYAELLAKLGLDGRRRARVPRAHPELASGLHRSPHAAAGTAADRLAEIAPFIGKSEREIRVLQRQGARQEDASRRRARSRRRSRRCAGG